MHMSNCPELLGVVFSRAKPQKTNMDSHQTPNYHSIVDKLPQDRAELSRPLTEPHHHHLPNLPLKNNLGM
jgi:hypothetical protein